MTNIWLPNARRYDLSSKVNYGPFGSGMFHGVIVHVNDVNGDTSDGFYANNPDDVCPNFQVDRDGTIHQYLPLDWQPWCQRAGNQTYAAIETGGRASEGYTKAQIASIGSILAEYHKHMGLALRNADAPGQYGIGMHRMGGEAWGGHSCPGDIRAGQRGLLIAAASGSVTPPFKPPVPRPPVVKLRRLWPSYMPAGHYFGLLSGPAASHGGYYTIERSDIKAIQQRLIQLGHVPGHTGINDGWADGIFEQPTKNAVTSWQKAHYASSTSRFGEVWSDDWARLFTY